SLPKWKRNNMEIFRELLHSVIPNIEEDWKWDVPVFLVNGKMFCAMSSFTGHTKFNFFNGAATIDEHNLFNSGLDSKKHRSINYAETDVINRNHLKDLIRAALASS